MSPYYKYKKEKFLEKYKCAHDTLEDLTEALLQYRTSESKIVRRAIFAYFQDFSEYIIDMCETYLVINESSVDSSLSAVKIIEKAYEERFFDLQLKDILLKCVKLRNRYTHDYYKRELSEIEIEQFCYSQIIYLEIFLESSKNSVVLKRKL